MVVVLGPNEKVIARVEGKQVLITDEGLVVEWRKDDRVTEDGVREWYEPLEGDDLVRSEYDPNVI